MTATGLEPTTTYLINKHSTIWPRWANDWAVLWVLICLVHLTVCSCQVTYTFQSKSTLYSCLNAKELLARSRHKIWSLIDCSWTRTHNYLVWIHSEMLAWHDKNIQSNTRTGKYSQHSSIIWPVWLNGWMFAYELSGYEFESSCSHLNFKFCAYFEQEVPSHPGNYRVWIHSETLYVIWQEYTVIFAVLDCFKYFILYELFPFRKHK